MLIPNKKIDVFVRDIIGQCFESRSDRRNRGAFYENWYACGAENVQDSAIFNKIYSSLDDLESLLFSPVSLRFHISDSEVPNLVNQAKHRAASARIRHHSRASDTDSMVSAAVRKSLVKGLGIVKQQWKREGFAPELVAPENFGVWRENYTKLDEDMEAFAHSMFITPQQFSRMIYNHPDREELERKARLSMRKTTQDEIDPQNRGMQVVVGGLYPFNGPDATPTGARGIVDWMSQPRPQVAPQVMQSLMELVEVWVWNDKTQDWATFQIVGDDMLIMGKYRVFNALAQNPNTLQSVESLKGKHPFSLFCANPLDDYFWGRSEVSHIFALQQAINARINGTNRMLRMQEDPSTKFMGSTGVNQLALSKYRKPGGYYVEQNPNAKIEKDVTQIPQDLWGSLHEYERMFDDMMGLPPIAKGKGDAGVRSHAHAETLVRQFSPRFKDRAILIERDVERLGALMLDIARENDPKQLIAWCPAKEAGVEADKSPDPFMVAPAEGLAPVKFTLADLPDDVSLTVDSHSSSPAFSQDAKAQMFDLLKIGAMSPEDILDRSDVTDPDDLIAGTVRREIAKAKQAAAQAQADAAKHANHGGKRPH